MSAVQQHADLARIALALERIADALEYLSREDRAVAVRQAGAWITRDDRP